MSRLGNEQQRGVWSSATLIVAVLFCSRGGAFEPAGGWKMGRDFQRALANRFGVVSWAEGTGVRDQLRRLSELQRVAIFLDRRIDPSVGVCISLRDVTLGSLLEHVAMECGGATAYLGNVVYIGPQQAIAGLSQVAAARTREARALDVSRSARLLAERRWSWQELTEPRALLDALAKEADVAMEGAEQVPHDLWPAVELPPMSWVDRLTLVVTGFGLTFEIMSDGDAIRFVKLPDQRLIAESYEAVLTQMKWDALIKEFPRASLVRSADGVTLEGTPADHARLKKLLTQLAISDRAGDRPSQEVHSLRVSQQPVGAILKTLERDLQLRLEIGADIRDKLETRVTFDVRDVSLEQLLDATLTPASLTYRREGEVLHIERQR